MNTPTKPTFHAPGKDWLPHTPGDPMPCDGKTKVYTYQLYEAKSGQCINMAGPALLWPWQSTDENAVLGWRYADPQPESAESVTPSQGGTGQGGLYGMVMGPNGPEKRLLESVENALKRIRDNLDELARLREENANMRAVIKEAHTALDKFRLYVHRMPVTNLEERTLNKNAIIAISKLQPFTQP